MHASASAWQETCCARVHEKPLEPPRFSGRDGASKATESIVAAPLIVLLWIRPLRQFLDQAVFEQPANCCVKTARAEPQRTIGALEDILHHRVAVPVPIGKRDEDVERVAVKRQE